jgi:hypothetical protein
VSLYRDYRIIECHIKEVGLYEKIQINSPFVHSHILIRVMKGAPRVLDYYHVEVNEALNFGRQSGCRGVP